MKKYKLLLLILVSGLLIFFSYRIVKKSGSSVETEYIDFAIKDIENIDRFTIADDFGKMDIHRDAKGNWVDQDGNCISIQNVEYVLDAARNIEFKGYLDEGSVENFKKIMVSRHIKVEYFKNGKLDRTWYIGPPSKDHLGQVMLLDSKEYGMSDRPVLMNIKGVFGIIEPRFFGDPKKWQCTQIFSYNPNEITKVDINYPLEPSRSFSVENLGGYKYSVKQQKVEIQNVDTANVMLYLNKFKKVNFDIPNYSFTKQQIDSLKRTSPFCIMSVKLKTGDTKKIEMYRLMTDETNLNEFGVPVTYDISKFWAVLPNGELVKCQYYHFDPMILGHIYFPMDLSSIKIPGAIFHEPEHYKKD